MPKKRQRCDKCLREGRKCVTSTKSPDTCLRCLEKGVRCTREASKRREACANCRIKKLKCSHDRPNCSRCIRNEIDCLYNESPQLVEREIASNEPPISNHQFELSIRSERYKNLGSEGKRRIRRNYANEIRWITFFSN